MKRGLLIAALVFPFIILGGSLVKNEANLSNAETFLIPVTGYDPRDVLRGRYVQVAYDLELSGDTNLCVEEGCRLCLLGPAPDGRRATVVPTAQSCKNEVADLNGLGDYFFYRVAYTFSIVHTIFVDREDDNISSNYCHWSKLVKELVAVY